jgi:hypothetical protein
MYILILAHYIAGIKFTMGNTTSDNETDYENLVTYSKDKLKSLLAVETDERTRSLILAMLLNYNNGVMAGAPKTTIKVKIYIQ